MAERKWDPRELGFVLKGKTMDNGEARVNLVAPDGADYIRTEAADAGGWQNAHHHRGLYETYVVIRGWMAWATAPAEGKYQIGICAPGCQNSFTSEPGIDHNIYLAPGTAIHTVKHGTPIGNPEKGSDWYEANPAFAKWTKELPPALLGDIAGNPIDIT